MRHLNYLRFCPQCILGDKKQFCECYWHRLHQVPGVEVCLIHNIILQKSEVGTGAHRRGLVSAEEAVKTKINNYLELSDVNLKHFIQLAHNVDWLLKYPNVIFLEILYVKFI